MPHPGEPAINNASAAKGCETEVEYTGNVKASESFEQAGNTEMSADDRSAAHAAF